jgi:hypothetical protein
MSRVDHKGERGTTLTSLTPTAPNVDNPPLRSRIPPRGDLHVELVLRHAYRLQTGAEDVVCACVREQRKRK